MSTEHGVPVIQEEDRLPGRGLTAVIVFVALVIIALSGWSWAILRPRLHLTPPRPAAATVGMVDQTLIGTDTSAYALAERKRKLLESYGWVSEPAGIARIPIERAMQLVAEGVR
jgi:hypothetical protein